MGRGEIHTRTLRKSREKKPGKRRISIWMLVLLFFFLCGSFVFLRSPFFKIRNVEVEGARRVSKEEIIARMGQKGVNIFALDLDKAQKAIESSPFVEKAICKRRFPDTVLISIQERIPVAFVPFNEKLFLIDGMGRVLGEDDGSSPYLRALTGITEPLQPGQFLDQGKYGWALTILISLSSDMEATEINIQDGDCTLILEDGCKVYLGSERKEVGRLLALLKSILSDLGREGKSAQYIDLRFDKPSVKLRSSDGR